MQKLENGFVSGKLSVFRFDDISPFFTPCKVSQDLSAVLAVQRD